MVVPDILQEEACYPGRINSSHGWDNVHPLGEPVNDHHDGIVSPGGWEFGDEINRNHLPTSVQDMSLPILSAGNVLT